MKEILLIALIVRRNTFWLIALMLLATCEIVNAQGTWTQKADVGGLVRASAVGFSIGNYAYIGTGGGYYDDFWQYDPINNTWMQKASFPGGGRHNAVGFSIGNYEYLGTGVNSSTVFQDDFWQYDPSNNIWTAKANYGGGPIGYAVGFSIGNYGFVGTGTYATVRKDFWQYDPANDSWTRKADFGGSERQNAVGFSIRGFGYIGTGNVGNGINDFWQYDPSIDTWTQKANVDTALRGLAVGFSINNKGYIGTGQNYDGTTYLLANDFWEYDPTNDSWSQKANFGGTNRYDAVGFSIGNRGYIGTGYAPNWTIDFWEYAPDSTTSVNENTFTTTALVFPNPVYRSTTISFSLSRSVNLSVCIYDITGNLVGSLFTGKMKSGSHELKWDVSDENRIYDGIYFLNFVGESFSHSSKIVVVK